MSTAPRCETASVPPCVRATLRGLAGLLIAVLAVVGPASAAGAHAELVRSTPANGAALDESPDEVVLVFTEPVSADLGGLRVLDADGGRVDDGAVAVDGTRVSVGIADPLPDGAYVASYRVVSADSHPIRGGIVFSVGDAEADPSLLSGVEEGGDRWWDWAGNVTRWVAYLGTLAAAGGALFLIAVHRHDDGRRRLVRIVTAASAVGAIGILAALPVQAALATGRGISSLFDDGVLTGVLAEDVGWATAAGLCGLLLVVIGVRLDASIAGLGALVAAGSFAITGHNRASDVVAAAATISDAVHLWAAAAWFGGLVLLPVALRRVQATPRDLGSASGALATDTGRDEGLAEALRLRQNREIVRRFSNLAAVAVVAVAMAGGMLAWIEVRSIDALTSTDYGALLIAKVGVVALAVGLAIYNNRILAPPIRDGRGGRVPTLRKVATLEALLLAVVLGMTAILVQVTPARTADRDRVVEEVVALGDAGSVQVIVDPARAGQNVIHLYTLDPDGVPEDLAEEVSVSAELPSADLGPLRADARRAGPSHFQVDEDVFPAAGTWQLTVRARLDRFTEESATLDVPIAP